jgi:hypothetical protein
VRKQSPSVGVGFGGVQRDVEHERQVDGALRAAVDLHARVQRSQQRLGLVELGGRDEVNLVARRARIDRAPRTRCGPTLFRSTRSAAASCA